MTWNSNTEIEEIKDRIVEKYPAFGAKIFHIEIVMDMSVHQIGTNGDAIFVNPNYFHMLNGKEKEFVFAHEICHIAFRHVERGRDKKYPKLWSIATDACINAFLKKDGFFFPAPKPKRDEWGNFLTHENGSIVFNENEEVIDGLYRDAETIYDKLAERQEKLEENPHALKSHKKKTQKNSGTQKDTDAENDLNIGDGTASEDGEIGGGLDDVDIEDYQSFDDHDIWTENIGGQRVNYVIDSRTNAPNAKPLPERPETKNIKITNLDTYQNFAFVKNAAVKSISEKDVFKENDELRLDALKVNKREAFSNIFEIAGVETPAYVESALSWKKLLEAAVEDVQDRWGYRRSSKFYPNARLCEVDIDGRPITEVVLDTSGSITNELLRGFLRQLVPMFKETDIKVGCFGGSFHGFQDLTTQSQVEEFKAVRDDGGTNFEAAALAFSKDSNRRVNRVVFTDGVLDGKYYHRQKTKRNVIWLVFGDKSNFEPVGGRVIKISSSELFGDGDGR